MTQNKLIDYRLDEMPSGDFVGECYMLTHSIIKALGDYATQQDKYKKNKQFIDAEKTIRDYVWKSCQRAVNESTPSQPMGDVAEGMAEALRGVIRVADRATVEFDAAKESLAAYEAEKTVSDNGWFDISTAPKHCKFDVLTRERKRIIGCEWDNRLGVVLKHSYPRVTTTIPTAEYWMPEPQPPTEAKNE